MAISQPQNESGLLVVKFWLAALLCGLRIEQRGGYYDVMGMAISLR
jgi:hypothetical protein